MRIALMASAIAIAMTSVAGVATAPAQAQAVFNFSINPGDIAFGYADGYWDRYQRWHPWSPAEARWYRQRFPAHYYHMRHDRVRNNGWRDRWWAYDPRFDRDRDGIPNRFDRRNDNGPYGDRDRDGVPNRYDRRLN